MFGLNRCSMQEDDRQVQQQNEEMVSLIPTYSIQNSQFPNQTGITYPEPTQDRVPCQRWIDELAALINPEFSQANSTYQYSGQWSDFSLERRIDLLFDECLNQLAYSLKTKQGPPFNLERWAYVSSEFEKFKKIRKDQLENELVSLQALSNKYFQITLEIRAYDLERENTIYRENQNFQSQFNQQLDIINSNSQYLQQYQQQKAYTQILNQQQNYLHAPFSYNNYFKTEPLGQQNSNLQQIHPQTQRLEQFQSYQYIYQPQTTSNQPVQQFDSQEQKINPSSNYQMAPRQPMNFQSQFQQESLRNQNNQAFNRIGQSNNYGQEEEKRQPVMNYFHHQVPDDRSQLTMQGDIVSISLNHSNEESKDQFRSQDNIHVELEPSLHENNSELSQISPVHPFGENLQSSIIMSDELFFDESDYFLEEDLPRGFFNFQ